MTLDHNGLYTDFVIVEQQGERARPGQGYVHHIAVNTPKDSDLNSIHKIIEQQPENNSGIIDRYFSNLYILDKTVFYTNLPRKNLGLQ